MRYSSSQKGFSLIELLVVMVIIGIILSFVVVTYGDFGRGRTIEQFQQHFLSLLKLAKTKAIIEANTYGVDVSVPNKKITFYKLHYSTSHPYGEWQVLYQHKLFHALKFPDVYKARLQAERIDNQPEILITYDGHISPFSFTLWRNDSEQYTIYTDKDDQLNLTIKQEAT